MSDTSAPSAPSAPVQTVQTVQDVPVNVEQTTSPTPIGSQVVERPVNQTPSRREAIQAAFDRANNPQAKGVDKGANKPPPKAADAKLGHNQPPEPTEKVPPAGIPRGERGQFAPRTAGVLRARPGRPRCPSEGCGRNRTAWGHPYPSSARALRGAAAADGGTCQAGVGSRSRERPRRGLPDA